MAKPTGLSREPRIRAKQEKTLEAYAERAAWVAGDHARDQQARIMAVEEGGYTRAQTNEAKLKQFERLWRSDDARQYLAELWSLAVPDQPDPVSVAFQTVYEHMVQNDTDKWGEARDRSISLSASREVIKLFVPAQTTRVLTGHLSAKVERPAAYDTDQPMTARTILPAGTTIAKPTGPTGSEDDEDPDDDD